MGKAAAAATAAATLLVIVLASGGATAAAGAPAYELGPWNMAPWSLPSFPDAEAKWIWSTPDADDGASTSVYDAPTFSYVYDAPAAIDIKLYVAIDERVNIDVNGITVAQALGGAVPLLSSKMLLLSLAAGSNTLAFKCHNRAALGVTSSPAGLLVAAEDASSGAVLFRTDATWTFTLPAAPPPPSPQADNGAPPGEVEGDACAYYGPNPCRIGECFNQAGGYGFSCNCPEGYAIFTFDGWSVCVPDRCSESPCDTGLECHVADGEPGYVCGVPSSTNEPSTAPNTTPALCDTNPCGLLGTCYDTPMGNSGIPYTCDCAQGAVLAVQPGASSATCVVDKCIGVDCGFHGTCVNEATQLGYRCWCGPGAVPYPGSDSPGYTCIEDKCSHGDYCLGGACVNQPDFPGFGCQCPEQGYESMEVNGLPSCVENKCERGEPPCGGPASGECTFQGEDLVWGYSCECNSGFELYIASGWPTCIEDTCENLAAYDPCGMGGSRGSCRNVPGGYECDCVGGRRSLYVKFGLYGPECQVPQRSPTAVPPRSPPGGKWAPSSPRPPSPSPPKPNVASPPPPPPPLPPSPPPSPPQPVDTCKDVSCGFGQCVADNSALGYRCQCKDGFVPYPGPDTPGYTCIADACDWWRNEYPTENICGVTGTCVNQPGSQGYTCTCPDSYVLATASNGNPYCASAPPPPSPPPPPPSPPSPPSPPPLPPSPSPPSPLPPPSPTPPSPSPPPPPPFVENCFVLLGWTYQGNVVRTDYSVSTPADCCNACNYNSNCAFWMHDAGTLTCKLFQDASREGFRPSGFAEFSAGSKNGMLPGVLYMGGDVPGSVPQPLASPAACQAACQAMAGCVIFAYNMFSRYCSTKLDSGSQRWSITDPSNDNKQWPAGNWVSGVRKWPGFTASSNYQNVNYSSVIVATPAPRPTLPLDKKGCIKSSYGRGAGSPVDTCPPGFPEKNGALCYPSCAPGYYGVGPVCWQGCPPTFHDDGCFCNKGIFWRGGYVAWGGHWCEAEHGIGNCEWWGAMIYPKCPAGWYNAACCICSRDCPPGMYDIGVSCAKHTYGRGAGAALWCNPELEQNGALCYPRCAPGYYGVGPVCWSEPDLCPPEYPVPCGDFCTKNLEECISVQVDFAVDVAKIAVNIVNLVNCIIASIATAGLASPCLAGAISKIVLDGVQSALFWTDFVPCGAP